MMRSWMRLWLGVVVAGGIAAGPAAGAEPGELSLSDCIRLALEDNAQLRQARLDHDIAHDDVHRARAGLLPQLSADVGTGRFFQGPRVTLLDVPVGRDPASGQTIYEQRSITQDSFSRDNHSLGFSLSQSLYDGGRRWHGYGQAKAERVAAALGVEATELEIVYEVNRRYFELLLAEALLEVREGAVAVAREQVKQAEELHALGAAPRADVLRSKVALGNERLELLDARNQVALAKSNLNHAMGRAVTDRLVVAGSELEQPARDVDLAREVAVAVRENPLLKQAAQRVEANRLAVKSAEGGRLPSLALRISYGRDNPDLSRVFSRIDENYAVGYSASVDFNLFDGLQTRADVARARARLQKTEEARREGERQLILGLQQAYLNLRVAQDRLEVAREQVRVSEEDLVLAQERYRLGAGTLLEQLTARTDFTRAKADRLRAHFDIRLAEAELERLCGQRVDR